MLEQEKQKDKVVVIKQPEVKIQQNHVGTLHPHKGHKVFEFEIESCTVAEVSISYSEVVVNKNYTSSSKKKSIDVKENCFYLTALNKKNAIKKLRKIGYYVIE